MTAPKKSAARLRVHLAPGIILGPGKADVLEGIRETGSIAAAGRRMKMSYKRAWSLVEVLNRSFSEPLVKTSRGGREQGGATLTRTGEAVLDGYRRMEQLTDRAIGAEIDALTPLLADPPRGT